MTQDWVKDMHDMHTKYGVRDWMQQQINTGNRENLKKFLEFRINFLEEELNETKSAFKYRNAEEIVDGLIDLCVIAIGTLDAFGAKPYEAWDEVFRANMNKEIGIKETRPNPLGLPDLIKPPGWKGPDHTDLEGNIGYALYEE